MSNANAPWYRELNRYHWFVLIVCTLGWVFDCFDQQLFALARKPAVAELMGVSENTPQVAEYTGYATSVLLIGWATGGIIFGIMGDKIGRARTMIFTILSYSVFTGLSGMAFTVWDFVFYRFMTGLGVGGQFAVGVALVAETMPDRARPRALGMLQAMASLGNVAAALVAMSFGQLEASGYLPSSAWRWMFAVGIVPALLAVVVIRNLKEPERWQHAKEDRTHKAGSLKELFGDPLWRHRAILGMLLASAGVIGLWGIGFFSIDLNRTVFRRIAEGKARQTGEAELDRQFLIQILRDPQTLAELKQTLSPQDLLGTDAAFNDPQVLFAQAVQLLDLGQTVTPDSVLDALDAGDADRPAQTLDQRRRRSEYLQPSAAIEEPSSLDSHRRRILDRSKAIGGEVSRWGGITSLLFNLGAFFGVYVFSVVTGHLGRRMTFALAFMAAALSTGVAFLYMDDAIDVLWMVPLMGFCQLSLFGGYAIYFPELFPTRLRSTGTSFCYNIGRYVAALGPSLLGLLTTYVFTTAKGYDEPMRYAGLSMCGIFLLGLVVLIFVPETKDKPLPE